ncbi:MAG: sporulation protein YqfD, partial [Oscillospiraceae bacterium]
DVVENIPKPESRFFRLPSNLVAVCDGVIDKAEVFQGELIKTVGSGVAKGDVIVSGTIDLGTDEIYSEDEEEQKSDNIKYVHSEGNIYGTFEKKVTVSQSYSDTEKVVSDKTIKRHYFQLFDVNVPLFLSCPEGNYIAKSTYSQAHIGSMKFPFGIKTVKLNKYSHEKCLYNESEAEKKAREQLSKYEKNFFNDYEIKSKTVKITKTKEGVSLTAYYKLYGNIACQSEFFIKK